MRNGVRLLLLLMFLAFLTACSGGDNDLGTGGDPTPTDPDPNDPDPNDPDPNDPTPVPVVSIGSIIGGNFSTGVIAVATTSLTARGSTSVYVDLIDDSGAVYLTPVEVLFNSPCVAQETATLASPVFTANGRAISTYTAQGCVGTDVINATVTTEAGTVVALGNVAIAAPNVGTMEHVSSNPEMIVLKGTGGVGRTDRAQVIFRAVDEFGAPFVGRNITFSIWPETGDGRGPSLPQLSGVTDQDGEVVAFVNAGTVPASVSVVATDDLSGLQVGSSLLTVATGIPDSDSFEINADVYNIRAWNYTGEQAIITASVGDRANHPVPDGTIVLFRAEGGMIDPSCATLNGLCSVTWRGQEPRPCGQTLGAPIVAISETSGVNSCVPTGAGDNVAGPQPGDDAPLGQPYAGRVTVTATVIGEESFDDVNNDDYFDAGELWDDLPEPFLDVNEDGIHDPREQHFELDNNGTRDGADGVFTGIACDGIDCNMEVLYLSKSVVMIMSGNTAYASVDVDKFGAAWNGVTKTLTLSGDNVFDILYWVSDLNHQSLPAGSTINVTSTYGTVTSNSYTVGVNENLNRAHEGGFTITGTKPTTPQSGSVQLEISVPGVVEQPILLFHVEEATFVP